MNMFIALLLYFAPFSRLSFCLLNNKATWTSAYPFLSFLNIKYEKAWPFAKFICFYPDLKYA